MISLMLFVACDIYSFCSLGNTAYNIVVCSSRVLKCFDVWWTKIEHLINRGALSDVVKIKMYLDCVWEIGRIYILLKRSLKL
jgi:hypothetical protein